MISVIIPTLWKANEFFFPMLDRMEDEPSICEVIIINNDRQNTPDFLSRFKKVKNVVMEKNVFFNLSMNIGVELSNPESDVICLMSDDVVFETEIFKFVSEKITNDIGMIMPNPDQFNMPRNISKHLTRDLTLRECLKIVDGCGCTMFVTKQNYSAIPKELVHHFGDVWWYEYQIKNNRKNYFLDNWSIETPMRVTTRKCNDIVSPVIANDWRIVSDVFLKHGLRNPL